MADLGQQEAIIAQQRAPPMPRWVKFLIIGALVLAVLLLLVAFLLGGTHGPNRHLGG